jgi:short-subunit dehydrogenase
MAQRRNWHDSRCLVTGASSGLGKAIAQRLARLGARVVLTGRSEPRLRGVVEGLIAEGVDPARLTAAPADLTIEVDRDRLFRQIEDQLGGLEVVINNAGVGATGQFDTHDPQVLRQVFEINVFALVEVCRRSLPLLARGQEPVMVMMGSINARRGLPGRSEYSASKFAVAGFTESIRIEWRRFGIHVLQINPGFSDTPFDDNAVVNTARVSVKHRRTMSADDVALATVRAIDRRRREVTLTTPGRLLLLANQIAPRFVDWGLTRWLLKHFPDAPVLQRRRASGSS